LSQLWNKNKPHWLTINNPGIAFKESIKPQPEPEQNTFEHLIWEMRAQDPSKRPTAKEALAKMEQFIKVHL
jgi:hypothetical protein